MIDLRDFLENKKRKIVIFTAAVILAVVFLLAFRAGFWGFFDQNKTGGKTVDTDVSIPTIVNGQLVLPKITTDSSGPSLGNMGRLGVISAQLLPVFDQQNKLVGLRILGEVNNVGDKTVDSISPVVRFFDAQGKVLAKKVGKLSSGFDFFGVTPGDSTLYDVTVDPVENSDKLEIVVNSSSSTVSAMFEPLKIASRSMEIKKAQYQGQQVAPASGAEGTQSAAVSEEKQSVEYYTISGSVVNTLSNPISDIAVYAWVKDSDNKVFAFSRQDFKNDLIDVAGRIDFKMTLLPLRGGEKYELYEVAAWGKEYKLNL